MKRYHSKGIILLLSLALLGCTSSYQVKLSAAAESSHLEPPSIDIASPLPTPLPRQSVVPTRLLIPAIALDAEVETVQVLSNGQMGVPGDPERVGILMPWTKAGEPGNAVISGHVDHLTGPAVFYDLKKLSPGDRVIVANRAGTELTFLVTSVETFKTEEAPLQRIFGATDSKHLNLITCTGRFNRKTQEHERRLVVFTELDERLPSD